MITNRLVDLPDKSEDLSDVEKLIKEWVGNFVTLHDTKTFNYIDVFNHHLDGEFMDYFKTYYTEEKKKDL